MPELVEHVITTMFAGEIVCWRRFFEKYLLFFDVTLFLLSKNIFSVSLRMSPSEIILCGFKCVTSDTHMRER